MPLVYRIENIKGEGLFSCWAVGKYQEKMKVGPSPYDHPAPDSSDESDTDLSVLFQKPRDETQKYIFGAASLEAILVWIPCAAGRRAIKRLVRISVYEVAEEYIVRGNYQLAFVFHKATLQYQFTVDTLEKVV